VGIEHLTPDEKLELLQLLELRDRRQRENWLQNYKPYPKQKEFHALGATHRERALVASNQGHPLDFRVLTPDGWRAIGDLEVGSPIIAGDGSACVVTGVTDLGERDIYEVSFDRGNLKVPCTDDHLWPVRSAKRDSYSVETTLQVLSRRTKPRTPGCGVVQFERRELPVAPYLLGLLLGDGCFTSAYVQISSNDDFILDQVRGLMPSTCMLVQSAGAHRSDWRITTKHQGRGRRNDLMDALDGLGLRGKRSEEKRVPQAYLLSSPEQRLQVLQGLMDSDGNARRVGKAAVRHTFHTSSRGLADDVAFMARSLGGHARILSLGRTTYRHPKTGEERPCLPGYSVGIRLPEGLDPCRLPRKVVRPGADARAVSFDHVWEGARLVGRAPARCITISHPSRLYICDGFIVTHNSGKSLSSAAEIAIHLTGLYPEWWAGHKFHRPVRGIVGSETAELLKKGMQRLILGAPEKQSEWGTGSIPKSHLIRTTPRPGVPDGVASITVKSEYGGESVLMLTSYEQGRSRWQADTVDFVVFDEEPPEDVYSEGLTRTSVTAGPVWSTFTPLLGMSKVVRRFLQEKPPGTVTVNMTLEDALHYTPEQRAAMIAAWPEHERDARARGLPMLGSGAVFPVAEAQISCEPIPIPEHWARIGGLDLGMDHPAAFVVLAHDRDSDTVYVTDAWRLKGKTIAEQAMLILGKGYAKMPWAWPHDALQRDRVAGTQIIKMFKDFGINTLAERAQFAPTTEGKPGGNSVEAGYAEMLMRMQTRRFRVFSHLADWFEEMRLLHRKDGQIVKLGDDLLSATRYAQMMLRKAQIPAEYDPRKAFPSFMQAQAPSFGVLDPLAGY
jgi:phage terminase large subunit-like protein